MDLLTHSQVTQYAVPQWDDALVGDDVTNPEPSFIGKGISKMLFLETDLQYLLMKILFYLVPETLLIFLLSQL